MKNIPVKVHCYSGYKTDEYPKSFEWKDEQFVIREIQDRWYQGEGKPEFPAARYFKVKTSLGSVYLLKHVLADDQWYLILKKD